MIRSGMPKPDHVSHVRKTRYETGSSVGDEVASPAHGWAMQQATSFPWQQALQDALREPDPQLARVKIADAEMAIFNRMQGFKSQRNSSEEQALFDGLETIRALKGLSPLGGTDVPN